MTTETITTAEMTADAKQVYKVDGNALIALADKYGATSKGLSFYRRNPDQVGNRTLFVAACGSKSSEKELRSAVYAAIKARIAQA